MLADTFMHVTISESQVRNTKEDRKEKNILKNCASAFVVWYRTYEPDLNHQKPLEITSGLSVTKWNQIRRYKGTNYKAFNTSLKNISSGLKDGKIDDNKALDINHKQQFHPVLLWWMCLVIKWKHQYCIMILPQCSWQLREGAYISMPIKIRKVLFRQQCPNSSHIQHLGSCHRTASEHMDQISFGQNKIGRCAW